MWSVTLSLAIVVANLLQDGRCETCLTPLADHEPLCNPSSNDSPWTASHRIYGQASSSYPGPNVGQDITAEHLYLPAPPITMVFTTPYDDGGVAVWTSPIDGYISKLNHDPFQLIDTYNPQEREEDPPLKPGFGTIAGAYNAIDKENNFILGRGRLIEVYADSEEGNRFSPIVLKHRIDLYRENKLCRNTDFTVGMTLSFDDSVVFVSELGVVGIIPRRKTDDKMLGNNVKTYSINADACADSSVRRKDLEIVSNSLVVDENGGIYVVTSKAMYKFHYNSNSGGSSSSSIDLVWSAEYNVGGKGTGVRLGDGSGSTPSLMGTALDDDRFVVITDGQDLMHLVLMWRDEIPNDWEGLSSGKDRRIACEVPVTFGDSTATRSLSEQSVLVRGYSAVVVNNLLRTNVPIFPFLKAFRRIFSIFEGGNPTSAPYGVERIDWDPDTMTCSTKWVNEESSFPNGIPTMSQATGLFYGIAQQSGVFGLEAIDFETGESAFFVPGAARTCSSSEIKDTMGFFHWLLIRQTLTRLPGSCENSFYSATEVGPDGTVYTGTFNGISKYSPHPKDRITKVPAIERANVGVRQGIDLCQRALGADRNEGRLDATERAIIQLTASLEAMQEEEEEEEGAKKLDTAFVATLHERMVAIEESVALLGLTVTRLTSGQGGRDADPFAASWSENVAMAQEFLEHADRLSRRR